MPKLSFVVSTCDRPGMLPIVLHSLAVQTFPDFEVIVTDNSVQSQAANWLLVDSLDSRFRHANTASLDIGQCYWTAEWAVKNEVKGDFVCFPSDDSYYVPVFAEVMLSAAERNRWDLVYCNMVYDGRYNGRHYSMVEVLPKINCIDKTGFILKRDWFDEFPGKVPGERVPADGMMIESLVRKGISHGKVPDVLMVHN